MNNIKIVTIEENINPKYIKISLIRVERNGVEFSWERISGHDSVHIIVDNTETKEFLLVKQVRIPVLINDNSQEGIVIEACAGLVDKDIPLIDIASEEVIEELGYLPYEITFLKSIKSSVGRMGNTSFLFCAKVNEKCKISSGGGIHFEEIETVRIPYNKVKEWILTNQEHTDAVTLFLLAYTQL